MVEEVVLLGDEHAVDLRWRLCHQPSEKVATKIDRETLANGVPGRRGF